MSLTIISAKFGNKDLGNKVLQDVTSIVSNLIINDRLLLTRDANLLSLFGDPNPGVPKILYLILGRDSHQSCEFELDEINGRLVRHFDSYGLFCGPCLALKNKSKIIDKPLSLSVLLTTIGRPVLANMLNSLVEQLTLHDYLYIVVDGSQYVNQAEIIINAYLCKFKATVIVIHHKENGGYWGHIVRNLYQSQLKGDYILHADDDDIYIDNAFNLIRQTICTQHTKLYFFKIKDKQNRILPKSSLLVFSDIGTPNGVVPNQPEKFGTWGLQHGGDFIFWADTTIKFKSNVHFSSHLIYQIR